MDKKPQAAYDDDELPDKVYNLPPNLQHAFLRAANQLMQKEAETFLDILSSTRTDLSKEPYSSPSHSPKRRLRSPFKRKDEEHQQRPVTAQYEQAAVDHYLRTVGRERTVPITAGPRRTRSSARPATSGNMASYARPVTAGRARPEPSPQRPGTAHRIRLDERPPLEHNLSLEELSLAPKTPRGRSADDEDEQLRRHHEEILAQMESQGLSIEEERRRQAHILRERKATVRDRKEKSANMADLLLDQSKQQDEIHNTTRERQQRLLQERLEKKRFQRRKSQINILVVQPADPDAESEPEDNQRGPAGYEPDRRESVDAIYID